MFRKEVSSRKEKFWRFSLFVDEHNNAALNWSYLTSRNPKKVSSEEEQEKDFYVELISIQQDHETLLHRYAVPKFARPSYQDYQDITIIGTIPFDNKTTDIVIFRKQSEIFRLKVSKEKPTVKLLQTQYKTQEKTELEWEFKTSNSTHSWFIVFIELDNGKRYPISDEIKTNKYLIDFKQLPGCEKGKLVVFMSDGVWTAEHCSETFKLPPKKPEILIFTPKSGQKIQTEDFLQLNGQAWDYQNHSLIPAENLLWKLDEIEVGKGKTCVINTNMELGKHMISLEAIDSSGTTYNQSVEIEIFKATRPKFISKEKEEKDMFTN